MPLSRCLALLAITLGSPAFAQTPPPPRPAPIVSPELKEDRSVTFRLRAPNAKEVAVRGQWSKQPLALTRSDEGVWNGSTEPVEPGVWEYSFVVDGLSMIDPGNPAIKPMREPRTSILQVPGTPPNPWDFQDVPHGAVIEHSYLSKALGRPRALSVYIPPGYETDAAAKYPLLVLQHGSGDNQQTWTAHGKAHWILDNLIAAGKVRPMVVLMIDGHPLGAFSPDAAKRGDALDAFRRELFEDALPLVEARYRVEKDAAHRAIAGLSMGGHQSLSIGLTSSDRFVWVGAFSAAPPSEAALKTAIDDSAGLNARLRLLWIAVGKDDFLRERNEQFVTKLKEGGVKLQWQITEGDHSWPVWRRYLVEFAPLLFRD